MPDDTLSVAIQEAYASAPVGQVLYHTLELYHPAFTQAVRVVRDHVALDARLESSAPRNAGEVVTFTAFAFDVTPPDVQSTAVPQCIIEIDNVGRELLTQVELAMAGTGHIQVIYRAYLDGNLNVGPENDPPLSLEVLSISATPLRIQAVCGFPDLVNRRFPSLDYTAAVFPGLIAQ
jgi:hypothetical protein